MRKYLGAEMLAHDSPALRFRDRNSSVGRLDTFMAAHTGVPSDFPRYVALSQWVQAETLRTGIETSRRRMWECSGVLFWQWNDCWPGITWSVVDVDGRLKAAYFAAKRAWRPRILAIADENSRYAVHVINDTEIAWSDVLFWKLLRFDGQVIAAGDFSVRPRSASLALVVPAPLEALRVTAFLLVESGANREHRALRLLSEYRDLERSVTQVTVEWGPSQSGTLNATVSCDSLALSVGFTHDAIQLELDDNFFDLIPGERRIVTFRAEDNFPLEANEIVVSWI